MQLLSAPTGTQAHTLTLSHSHTLAYTFSSTHTPRLSKHSLSAAIIKFDFLNLKTCINYNTKQSHTYTHTYKENNTHTHMYKYLC